MRSLWYTLWFRLTAAFLLVAVVGVLSVALLANQATTVGFRAYLVESQWTDLRADLADLYARQGNWEGAAQLLPAMRPGQGGIGILLLDETGAVVAASGGRGARPTGPQNADAALPVEVNGRSVGLLLIKLPGGPGMSFHAAEAFLADVNRALWVGGGAAVLLALILGMALAQRLTRPLIRLTQATRRVSEGDLNQHVPVAAGELGELAASFNQMAGALATAERQRQQLLADVAHELRTPLSIIRGHLEGMLDGVFDVSADNVALVHEETLLLGRLIEDLRLLSLAESGQLPLNVRPTDLVQVLRQSAAAFEPLAETEGVLLTVDVPSAAPLVMADADRLQQVLGNLAANALRYVGQGEQRPFKVQLRLLSLPGKVQVQVVDNGPGLSPAARRHVFDRFWRVDSSRARDEGGSGLGLSICRAIVMAHNGRIWVEDNPGGGAAFIFELPAYFDA